MQFVDSTPPFVCSFVRSSFRNPRWVAQENLFTSARPWREQRAVRSPATRFEIRHRSRKKPPTGTVLVRISFRARQFGAIMILIRGGFAARGLLTNDVNNTRGRRCTALSGVVFARAPFVYVYRAKKSMSAAISGRNWVGGALEMGHEDEILIGSAYLGFWVGCATTGWAEAS